MPKFGFLTGLRLGRKRLAELNAALPKAILQRKHERLLKRYGIAPEKAKAVRNAASLVSITRSAHEGFVGGVLLKLEENPENTEDILSYLRMHTGDKTRLRKALGAPLSLENEQILGTALKRAEESAVGAARRDQILARTIEFMKGRHRAARDPKKSAGIMEKLTLMQIAHRPDDEGYRQAYGTILNTLDRSDPAQARKWRDKLRGR